MATAPDPFTFHSDHHDKRLADKIAHDRPSAKKAMRSIRRRIDWLDDKAAIRNANGQPHDLYIEEREALLWCLDKIKDLSSKLLRYEKLYGPLRATSVTTYDKEAD